MLAEADLNEWRGGQAKMGTASTEVGKTNTQDGIQVCLVLTHQLGVSQAGGGIVMRQRGGDKAGGHEVAYCDTSHTCDTASASAAGRPKIHRGQ